MNINRISYNYTIKIKLKVVFIICYLTTVTVVRSQIIGPEYIKNTLTEAGVFNTPSYTFTTDYDEYREHDNIKGLFIDALDSNGQPTKVFSWYGVPENLASGEKAPAVVLVHGGGGTAFPNWVKQWTDHGYIAIAIAHEGQLPGAKDPWYPTWEFSGPRRAGFFRDADETLDQQWFYHAVADAILANSLLKSFPEVDENNIGINGISWGGILTNVITGIDQRFKFSVPVYGCGYLYDSPHYSQDLLVMSEAEKEFYYNNWEPSLYIPLQTLPIFYVNGNNDKQFAMNIATPSYNLIPSEKYLRIEHLMKHSTVAGYAPEEIYSFADFITKNGKAPITVSIDNVQNNSVTASYIGDIESAVLHYTTDVANWAQDTYDWLNVPATINQTTNKITAEIPENTKYYYINVTTDNDFIYSSVMKEVIDTSKTTVEVSIKATENTTYTSGALTMIGIGTVPESDATFEIEITVTPNGDFTTYPNAVIVSGTSDNNGTSTTKSWGISDDGANAANGDRIFQGDQQLTATISDAKLGTISGASGLTANDITIDTFKSITIVNGHNTGDRFTFSADNSADIELGRFNGEAVKIVDLVTEASDTKIESFTIKNGSTETNNKWAVENISVLVDVDVSNITLGVNNTIKKIQESFVIFPNPAKDTLTISYDFDDIEIYNVLGKKVKNYKINNKILNISNLNKGIYIIKAKTNKGNTYSKKFIKL
ncbi:acetylxylan esterase [Polaribacter vadi]|uniref:T9SS type A sorting domain-containing protein n=1 Tax=Polaribacter TaxID=52959 RepID=UPI001C07F1EE|nr:MULTISPECIES: T9SS type A sorting domain-containing protein [Polaribacter]MBU3011371.1 acetylxylan esterase [Polaribacter vadi]MDO6741183.1 acetylxylan esterase [Polaribacter sp. 1_MG-2023]